MREQHAVALVHVLQQPTEQQQLVVGEVGASARLATRDYVVERHGASEARCISCESAAELRLLGELISLKVNGRRE